MEEKKKVLWKHISEIRDNTLQYIEHRRDGLIKSYKTPWPKLNGRLLAGMEWRGLYLIAGESGVGKTAIVDQLITEGPIHNPDQNVAVLKFQFEMTDYQTAARELTSPTGLNLKQLFSAEEGFVLTDDHMKGIKTFHESRKSDNIFQITDPRTVDQLGLDVIEFYNQQKKPLIVMVDHSILVKRSVSEGSQLETLGALANKIVYLKKKVPAIFLVITQMNRSLDDPARKENGKLSNYPIKSDIYGGEQMFQSCDAAIIFMRPFKSGTSFYGPEKYVMKPDTIVAHIIKNRFDDTSIHFFESDLKHFRIKEAEIPPSKK